MSDQACPECGAPLRDGVTCQAQFEALLFLEYEHPDKAAKVHHLMVMCYMLHHNRYSDDAARWVVEGLEACLERGVTPSELRRQNRSVVDSGVRRWKVIGSTTLTRHIAWPMTIMDIDSTDADAYCVAVTEWARSSLGAIRLRKMG
jgi:hypothetical protein